jgi:asparagine synthase (glutamine-hydrolysing)
MCGLAGIIAFNGQGKTWLQYLPQAVRCLQFRGPDAEGIWYDEQIGLGHRRLSVIDVSESANQPMTDNSGRYVLIFNGEIFNYRLLKSELESKGITFKTKADTEVLLELYKREGVKCLDRLNGFFAFAIYDKIGRTTFIARDRFGVKPLVYYQDENVLAFASEIKSLTCFPFNKQIDNSALRLYFQFHYIPAPFTIWQNIKKLEPGDFLFIKNNKVEKKQWYKIPYSRSVVESNPITYSEAQNRLVELMDASVERRMIADVPLGAFLSGGLDSSAVIALASRHTNQLQTFSIGFRDEPFYDETKYAESVAKKFNTTHTSFSLTTNDLLEDLFGAFDYLDEPFADSSSLAVHILSKHTRKNVTVALSGDGADEVFGGYLKHSAEYFLRKKSILNASLKSFSFLWKNLPKSRNKKWTNSIRQLDKFASASKISFPDRYWQMASFSNSEYVNQLLVSKLKTEEENEFLAFKNSMLSALDEKDLNTYLLADVNFVLPNDMLFKVDSMSMASGLEVRTPFLDYEVVQFAFSLPAKFKLEGQSRKRIVHDAFKKILPHEIYNRPKRGFEIPLQRWMRGELGEKLQNDFLSDDFIFAQNIFNTDVIKNCFKKLNSSNPEDSPMQLWAILVFQYWYKKYVS